MGFSKLDLINLKDVRRLTRPVLGWRPAFLTEFSWFTLAHLNVYLKCLKTGQYCFSRNPNLTIIIILPHICIKQLSREESKPYVGQAVHCLVHILFILRQAVYRTYNTNASIFRNLSRYKGETFWTKFVLQNFPYKFQRVLNCDNEGANAVFRALHFCYRDLQHASALINTVENMQLSSWKFSVFAYLHSALTLAHAATHAKLCYSKKEGYYRHTTGKSHAALCIIFRNNGVDEKGSVLNRTYLYHHSTHRSTAEIQGMSGK